MSNTIHAGKAGIRVTVPKGATAYILEPGAMLPPDLQKLVEARARVLAEDKFFEMKQQQQNAQASVTAKVPTVDELAANMLNLLAPSSELEQNKIIAITLHRLRKHRRRAQEEREHTIITAQEVLAEAQQADQELDQIVAGNFILID
jgi:hypothetical protein